MSEVRIKIDVHTRSAEFHRKLHPMDSGDLGSGRQAFEQLVAEVRAWFAQQGATHAVDREAAS